MIDQYYTPPGLAALLVNTAKVKSPKRIADFAMGDGALLRAAGDRWPKAKLFGSDIDPMAEKAAHGLSGNLEFAALDFLGDHDALTPLPNLRQSCDVILLNPPFTSRGNRRYPSHIGRQTFYGSKALAFVCRSLAYLRPGGEALAIVPASCATSQRDSTLMSALRTYYTVDQIGEINRNAFEGCTVNVIILRIKQRPVLAVKRPERQRQTLVPVKAFQARITRGSMSVHDTVNTPSGVRVIHTSDLRTSNVLPQRWSPDGRRLIQGMAVLLPRVGRPDQSKLVLVDLPGVILSDCVIAIKTEPVGFEAELHRLLNANWSQLALLYTGSCAPYLTIRQLQELLLELGVVSERVVPTRSNRRGPRSLGEGSQLELKSATAR